MSHIIRSFLVFAFLLIVCFLFRLVFLLLHFDFTVNEMFESIFGGIRFDSQFCAGFASFYCLFGFIHKRFAKLIFIFLSLLIVIPELVFFVFFNVYHTKINSDLFLFKNESIFGLLNTAFRENYGLIPAFISFFIIIYLMNKFHNCLLKIKIKSKFYIVFTSFILFAFLMMITINQRIGLKARGILALMPEQNHIVLHSSTFGHLVNFYQTLQNEYKASKITFKSFNVGSPKDVVCEIFNINNCNDKIDIYSYLKNTKTLDENIKPKKIYYVITESLSNWALDDRFADLFEDLHKFVKEKATYIPALHNASNTKASLEAQFLGVFNNNYNYFDSYAKIKSQDLSMSKKLYDLGYTSKFYYGGGRNWAKTEDAGKRLLIKEFYGEQEISNWAKTQKYKEPFSNVWAVFDNILLDFAQSKSNDFSVNIIMTATNHPPYDLELLKISDFPIPFEKIEKISTKYKNELATVYWYQKTLINWIEKTAEIEPDSLFVITGDHYGRYNIDDSNDLFTTHSVPVIFYYPKAKIYPTCKITNHLDIAASIVELIALKDYEYISFGSPCFSLNEQNIETKNKYGFDIEFVDGKISKEDKYLQKLQALSWYLVYKGNIVE